MKKLLIGLAVVLAVALVVYLTKPGPPSYEPADTGDTTDAQTPDIPSYRAPAQLEDRDAGAPVRDGGPTASSVPVAKHGKEAVVRSKEGRKLVALSKPRQRYPADWDKTVMLPFRELKKLRREQRRADFSAETVRELSGAAVRVRGAVMPIDPVGKDGVLERFWIANTMIVMAGCVFCFPPTMGDLVYVDARKRPYKVDREQLYRSIVRVEATGRLELGPAAGDDGVLYLFGLELREIDD